MDSNLQKENEFEEMVGGDIMEEEEIIQYCRDRLELYIILEKRYGHEKACRILSLYDLE